MKKIILFSVLLCSVIVAKSQTTFEGANIEKLLELLKEKANSGEDVQEALNGIIKDPAIYDELWKSFLDLSAIKGNDKFNFLKDLNIKFKTFQTDDQSVTSLGFSYDFKYDFAKFGRSPSNQVRKLYKLTLSADGNVAFKRSFNPNDFLETKFNYIFSSFSGGVVQNKDTAVFDMLNELDDKLANLKDMRSAEARALWEEHGRKLVLSDQFYYSVAPKFALESNQNFTKTQFTPGIVLGLGAKGWNNKSGLAKANVLDYPFALLRLLLGTDRKFTPYGATLPSIQTGIDYVIPAEDEVRKGLLDKSEPFPRFRFEVGFRTFISRIKKENIFFSSNYRYYSEIGADEVIKTAKLDQHSYFVMALQTTTGFYVSYSAGKLPFDAKNDQVYALGFNYQF